jgi:hypothetical protein
MEEGDSHDHLELTRVMFVAGSVRMTKASDTKIPPKKKVHNKLKRMRRREERRNIRKVQIFRSETQLELILQFSGL